MAITFIPHHKKKPWVLTWGQPYTKRKRSKSFISNSTPSQVEVVSPPAGASIPACGP